MSETNVFYDVEAVRKDFPILLRSIRGKPLVYLDNASSTQRPAKVIDAMTSLYEETYANVHRGVHTLSMESTALYEEVRSKVRDFINAACIHEVVFTSGTTESINLLAQSCARPTLGFGDEILITHMEHHSNIVPWQLVCEQTGAVLKVVPISDRGEVEMEQFHVMLGERTKMVAVAHISNVLGTVNPIEEMIAAARARGLPVLVDGAQAVPHMPVDVQELDVDFYVFSGHKLYAPTGVGVLYGKESLLQAMPPYKGGGDMILSVRLEGATYRDPPYKFEAGTPNIAGIIGLGAAIDYVNRIGVAAIAAHEQDVLESATAKLGEIKGLQLIGEAGRKAALLSFVLDGVHPHDIGTMLDAEGIAIRAGHHCAQPLMERYGVSATARASFGMYNTREEIDVLAEGIEKTIKVFA